MGCSEYHEEDARTFFAMDPHATMPVWRLRPILAQYLSLVETQRADIARVPRVAFAALRSGTYIEPPLGTATDYGDLTFGPHTGPTTCAICGPLPTQRRCWCFYDNVWWVFCIQCCDAWQSSRNGNGPSRVVVLLEAALREVELLRCGAVVQPGEDA